jgi:hypothetical protein
MLDKYCFVSLCKICTIQTLTFHTHHLGALSEEIENLELLEDLMLGNIASVEYSCGSSIS